MNLDVINDYLPLYTQAAKLTVSLGIAGIAISILIGLLCAFAGYFRIPVLSQVAAVYIELSRNTPLLIQLFFIYYGLPKLGISVTPGGCGVAGLAFLGGSYMAETFRSGLSAIPGIQEESALDRKSVV